jgi:alanyl-tRNA synthetase
MKSSDIRSAYLDFYKEKGHTVVPSSSLVPHGDPTLLLTSAGMVQMKPYFIGEATPPSPRLVSCQKCFRTTDIDVVGDAGHLTYFEMLGNFSIGDYFKKEAIAWSWEFVIERLKLPQENLWITVFLDDDEAENYWLDLGVAKDRILRCDEKDNFWGPAGESGPCGPCSEIHYDFGEGTGCGSSDCGPSCDCDRFSEIWNLVFTELDQDAEGNRTPLKQKNIDTGMGLERTAALMQGKRNVYETDLFTPMMDRIADLTGRRYGETDTVTKAMRVVAEHGRAITFLIADGVIPSNDGRGYVLRRILRRAALFGRKLGLTEAFLTKIAEIVVEQMGDIYPELTSQRDYILKVIDIEEEKFDRTITDGLERLEGMIEIRSIIPKEYVADTDTIRNRILELTQWADNTFYDYGPKLEEMSALKREAWIFAHGILNDALSSARQIQTSGDGNEAETVVEKELSIIAKMPTHLSGFEVFRLWDTFGFPKEITSEIAAENGLSIDLEGFEEEMEAQRERARGAKKFGLADKSDQAYYESLDVPPTEFVGYDEFFTDTLVVGLIVDGEPVETAFKGQDVQVILGETPFYGENGGQVGDIGEIKSQKGTIIVSDSQKPIDSMVVHWGKVNDGVISVNDPVEAIINSERRLDIARNHTATHILHAALREVLGEQVRQGGSLVDPDHFRFDFTHLISLSKDELEKVQHKVNQNIRRNLDVSSQVMPYSQAIGEGALAFFGDKYGDEVRLVEIRGTNSTKTVSAELCGGTHMKNTGEIGFFHITSEKSIGSGLRRIEAVTGRGAEALADEKFSVIENMAAQLETNPAEVVERLSSLIADFHAERKRAKELEGRLLRKTAESLLSEVKQVDGVNVLAGKVVASDMELLRQTGDWLKDKLGSAVIVLGVVLDGNPRFLIMVTPDLVSKGIHAGNIIKQVAQVTGGGGGGKPDMAQAGGKDKSKIDEALRLVPDLIGKL